MATLILPEWPGIYRDGRPDKAVTNPSVVYIMSTLDEIYIVNHDTITINNHYRVCP